MWAGETPSARVLGGPRSLADITHISQGSAVTFVREALAGLASGPNNLHFHNSSVTFCLGYSPISLPCWVLWDNCFQLLQIGHAIYNNFLFRVNLNAYGRHDTLDEEGPVKFLGRQKDIYQCQVFKCLSNCLDFLQSMGLNVIVVLFSRKMLFKGLWRLRMGIILYLSVASLINSQSHFQLAW